MAGLSSRHARPLREENPTRGSEPGGAGASGSRRLFVGRNQSPLPMHGRGHLVTDIGTRVPGTPPRTACATRPCFCSEATVPPLGLAQPRPARHRAGWWGVSFTEGLRCGWRCGRTGCRALRDAGSPASPDLLPLGWGEQGPGGTGELGVHTLSWGPQPPWRAAGAERPGADTCLIHQIHGPHRNQRACFADEHSLFLWSRAGRRASPHALCPSGRAR